MLAVNAENQEGDAFVRQHLIDEDADLISTARALAQQLAQLLTRGFSLQKRAFLASLSNSLEDQLELEAQLQSLAAETDDYREGVMSFLEKRKPNFVGR